jgi:hypothetical protein
MKRKFLIKQLIYSSTHSFGVFKLSVFCDARNKRAMMAIKRSPEDINAHKHKCLARDILNSPALK